LEVRVLPGSPTPLVSTPQAAAKLDLVTSHNNSVAISFSGHGNLRPRRADIRRVLFARWSDHPIPHLLTFTAFLEYRTTLITLEAHNDPFGFQAVSRLSSTLKLSVEQLWVEADKPAHLHGRQSSQMATYPGFRDAKKAGCLMHVKKGTGIDGCDAHGALSSRVSMKLFWNNSNCYDTRREPEGALQRHSPAQNKRAWHYKIFVFLQGTSLRLVVTVAHFFSRL
jgi:hypothetical protein